MDADRLFWRFGLANHLARPAAATMGCAKYLAGPFCMSATADSSGRTDTEILPQHDLGGRAAYALFHHRHNGNLGQPATTHTRIDTGHSGHFLPFCFQKKESG